ncbi:hypothetical protein Tco_0895545 [Tanacetum coccineum]|uniref:Uncharacterized protein n=1 Tax=Tanacetum coccineum TaxID=301880 RepID=A0ABQ5CHG1_9ASTR
MHNNNHGTGSKDRPPSLDQKCIFEGPYMPTNVLIAAVEAAENTLPVDAQEVGWLYNKESLNSTRCYKEQLSSFTMQVNVQFLQQQQPEWVEICDDCQQRQEKDKSANPLALLAAAQPYSDNYYQAPKPQRSNAPSYMQSSSTRPSASTRHKGKEIAKPVTPQSESVYEEDSDPEQARRDKDMKKNLALLAKYFKKLYKPTNNNLRTSSNSRNKTEDTTPRKPKRVKDYAYHKEKMMMCKQAEQGVPLQAEQADWLEDTDEEIDEQELEAHYSYMAKIQEVSPEESSSTSQPLEQVQNHDENDVFANDGRHSEQPNPLTTHIFLEKDIACHSLIHQK